MDVDIEPGLGTESNLFAKPSVPVTTTSMNFAAASSSSNVFTSSSSIDQDSVMGETEFGSDAGLQSENGDKERPSTSTDEKRRFKKTCLMVWSKLAEHRYGNVFTRAEKSPFYLNVIKNPINLAVIKNKIRDGEIATIEEFHHDILLMLANAVMFNDEGSEIAEMAKTLRIFVERELAALENVRRLKEFMSRD
ncbi:Bromodomain-containing protein [Obelidium mucronatum]|nr:Bromodomain-containing protein [Obelidium mucronatum]